jgi:hypothetical protein
VQIGSSLASTIAAAQNHHYLNDLLAPEPSSSTILISGHEPARARRPHRVLAQQQRQIKAHPQQQLSTSKDLHRSASELGLRVTDLEFAALSLVDLKFIDSVDSVIRISSNKLSLQRISHWLTKCSLGRVITIDLTVTDECRCEVSAVPKLSDEDLLF